ncbi:hypothetical protein I302_107473 [Kwoniella bestiolae CBS 10118]|uniref:Uncharacterized protein n=1 Tax=Kwoniella bestiolae CBS 10118 TaxID=1296100 RepID=A0A1B9FYF9_9TREE|nr:hypothetical protein I302_06786 [Kwoniella bestiolae CBS 10118]OCF23802.1 hypothetical protein I302_06786 [Kwoniella bestiolae CBS 10118]
MTNSPTSPSSSELRPIQPTPPVNIRSTNAGFGSRSGSSNQPTSPSSPSNSSPSMGSTSTYDPHIIDKQPWDPKNEFHMTRIFSEIGKDMQPSAKGQILSGIYEDLQSTNKTSTVTVGEIIEQGKERTWNYRLPARPIVEGSRYLTE